MVKIKYKGIILIILSIIGITFLLFNGILQAFEFFIKYQIYGFVIFAFSFIFSVIYSFIENSDGKGW